MAANQPLDASIVHSFPAPDQARIDRLLAAELARHGKKIVVLDDDPTGVQTVHSISVYTQWDEPTLEEAFAEENRLFFILTNSRGLVSEQTVQVHRQVAAGLLAVSARTATDFILVSRSDSTLRGHYPLETQTLKEAVEAGSDRRYDGEIICPFFKEGGRYTIGDVHYVQEGSRLTPAGETEFARDRTFGYTASHLGAWCEEKSGGTYRAERMIYISLDDLRAGNVSGIERQLLDCAGFNKVIVNAVDEVDVKVFAVAFFRALAQGKQFLIRSAAALPKVLGGVTSRPLLAREELVDSGSGNGGIIIVGSHVNKTTRQLEELRQCSCPIEMIEFDQHRVLSPGGLHSEVARVIALVEHHIGSGRSAAVYTRRERLDLPGGDKEQQLSLSVQISDAITSIVAGLSVRPGFIIAKGGITSSDIGTRALRVRRATVMGQIRPGIPVWMTGPESKFPNMAYIIFPGNVGDDGTLREIVETLLSPP